VLPGEFRDLLATTEDGLLVGGSGVRVATLDRSKPLDLGRQEAESL
jgi:hypothetical protein